MTLLVARAAAILSPGSGSGMPGPSDGFFVRWVQASHSPIAPRLAELQAQQAAAQAQGRSLSLADLAVHQGLLPASHQGELVKMEARYGSSPPVPPASTPMTRAATPTATAPTLADPAPTAPTRAAGSGSAGAKLPSDLAVFAATPNAPSRTHTGRVPPTAPADPGRVPPTAPAGKAPASAPHATPGTPPAAPADGASAPGSPGAPKRLPSGALRAVSSKTRRPAATPAKGSTKGPAKIIFAVGILFVVVASAALVVYQLTRPRIEPTIAHNDAHGDTSVAGAGSGSTSRATPTPAKTASPTNAATPDEGAPVAPHAPINLAHKTHIGELSDEVVRLAEDGDVVAARRSLEALRAGSQEGDEDAIATAEAAVAIAKPKAPAAAASPSPSPSAPPLSESDRRELRAKESYATLRRALDPLLASFDLDGARSVLDRAPLIEGSLAADLEDDRAAPDALARLLALAEAGAQRSTGRDLALHRAAGGKVGGTLRSLDGHDLVFASTAGGETLVRVTELDRKDIAGLAQQKLPPEDKEDFWLGRGLAFYFAANMEEARASFEKAQAPRARRFLERARRETSAARPQPAPDAATKKPDPDAASPPVTPTHTPSTPPDPAPTPAAPAPAAPAIDVFAIQSAFQKLVHTPVNDDGGGRFSLIYDMSQPRQAEDFEARGAEKWDVSQGTRPQDTAKVLCGQLVAPAGADVALLHKVPLKGDFDIKITFFVSGFTADSSFLFVAGFDKKRFVGAQLGQVLVKNDGKKTVTAGAEPDTASFTGGKDVIARLARTGERLTLTWNKDQRGTLDGAGGLDGRWGIVARGVRLGIRNVEVHGTPELPKK